MAENTVHTLEFPTGGDFPVRGDLYLPPGGPTRAIVILAEAVTETVTWFKDRLAGGASS